MSRCLNRATLIGYLGVDSEIRSTPSGARVAAVITRWRARGRPSACHRGIHMSAL